MTDDKGLVPLSIQYREVGAAWSVAAVLQLFVAGLVVTSRNGVVEGALVVIAPVLAAGLLALPLRIPFVRKRWRSAQTQATRRRLDRASFDEEALPPPRGITSRVRPGSILFVLACLLLAAGIAAYQEDILVGYEMVWLLIILEWYSEATSVEEIERTLGARFYWRPYQRPRGLRRGQVIGIREAAASRPG